MQTTVCDVCDAVKRNTQGDMLRLYLKFPGPNYYHNETVAYDLCFECSTSIRSLLRITPSWDHEKGAPGRLEFRHPHRITS
jgi:hypothetical protein